MITEREFRQLVQDAFPGAEGMQDRFFSSSDACGYTVGDHLLVFDGGKAKWFLRSRFFIKGSEPQDACTLDTKSDLIGWVGYVQGEILKIAARTIVVPLCPADLFPAGYKSQPMRRAMALQLMTLQAVKPKVRDWMRVLIRKFKADWVEQDNAVGFRVNTAIPGFAGGRLTGPNDGRMTFEYSIKIPLNITLEEKNTKLVKNTSQARVFLVYRYLTLLLNFLEIPGDNPNDFFRP